MGKPKKVVRYLLFILVGAIAGFINGFFGAGGGLLLVPMLTLVGGADAKRAHATTLMCVLVMCSLSAVMYFIRGQLDFKLIALCSVGSLVGSLLGTKLLIKLKNNVIDLVFSLILICAGVLMIVL